MRTRKFLSTLIPALPMLLTALLVILVTVIFLTAMRSKAHAQFGGVEQPMFQPPPSGTFSLLSIPQTLVWWVASDVTSQDNLTNSGWIDRVNGSVLTNHYGTNWPIWQTNYIVFNKNWLTNTLPITGILGSRPYAIWWIIRINLNPWNAEYVDGHHTYHGSDDIYWATTLALASNVRGITNKVFHNTLIGHTNISTHQVEVYTNGVHAGYVDSVSAMSFGQLIIGNRTFPHDVNAYLHANLYEFAIFTNLTTLSSDIVSNLNYRMTNLYGINPDPP